MWAFLSVHLMPTVVKKSADLVLDNKGGDGAVRELCDLINKKW